jgi:hypothetical protein
VPLYAQSKVRRAGLIGPECGKSALFRAAVIEPVEVAAVRHDID